MCDPIGQAIHDYFENGMAVNIVIETNYTEDEQLAPSYFFRTIDEMPSIERTALKLSHGKILDIGAAAGCHALHLQERGFDVTALEYSKLAVDVMRKRGVGNVACTDITQFHETGFNTILLLMNGTGIGGSLEGLKQLLLHLKSLLTKGGKVLIDSSDVSYLFQEEDGSVWIDLANDKYQGEMTYTVKYKNLKSSFKWLFVDFNTLKNVAKAAGFTCELIEEGPHYDYLAQLTS